MARPRTPSNVLELKGAFKKNPQRKRVNEPKSAGKIGIRHIGPTDPKEIWDEIVSACAPNVLTVSDTIALEIACQYMSQFRLDPENYSNERVRILISLLAKFGMTPSDRAKLSIPDLDGNKGDDPWSQFMR